MSSISGNSDDDASGFCTAVSLERMVTLCDIARTNLFESRPADTPFEDLDRIAIENYVNLVLSGVGEDENYAITGVEDHEQVFDHPDCTLFRDVDSALVFREEFPWSGPYDILTTYQNKKSLNGYLHAHVRFEASTFFLP